jgi:HNH endonuclease
MVNKPARDYVLDQLNRAGFLSTCIKQNLYEVRQTHLDGDGKVVRLQIQSATTELGTPLGSFEKINSADIYVLVRADVPDDLRAYVYLTDFIAKAPNIKDCDLTDPFERNPGEKDPEVRDFWARSKWRFCKEEHLNAWHLIENTPPSAAINDLEQDEIGNDAPEYKRRMAGNYVRDAKVREQVLKRANGVCEYGGCTTFTQENGQAYLEAHHVISLSEQGIDRLSNVIALCANHHREAHLGEKWQLLQDEFIQILKKLAP